MNTVILVINYRNGRYKVGPQDVAENIPCLKIAL